MIYKSPVLQAGKLAVDNLVVVTLKAADNLVIWVAGNLVVLVVEVGSWVVKVLVGTQVGCMLVQLVLHIRQPAVYTIDLVVRNLALLV